MHNIIQRQFEACVVVVELLESYQYLNRKIMFPLYDEETTASQLEFLMNFSSPGQSVE